MAYGIYIIENVVSRAVYVGMTRVSFAQRWINHQKDLRAGKHRNSRLQNAWNKYGQQAFEFAILEESQSRSEAEEAENFYLVYLQWLGIELYNHKMPPYHTGGQVPGEASRQKMRDAHLGKRHTEEARAKISATMRGRKPARAVQSNLKQWPAFISPQGVIYTEIVNLTQFSRDHALDAGTMTRLVQGKLTQHRGWRIYIEGKDYTNIPNPRSKHWGDFVSPDGTIFRNVVNLNKFCRDHDLLQPGMIRLAKGQVKQYRGWRRLKEE